jgi:hypothetical protein
MNVKRTNREYLPILLMIAALTGCASQAAQAPEPHQAKAPDRFIYVSTESLADECYHDLGPVELQVPYAEAAVDPDSTEMNQRLRGAALEQYPDTDAVIRVDSHQNDIGTIVTYTGEAVELEQNTTVECALRDAPKVIDTAAAIGAVGAGGAVAAGMTNSVTAVVAGAGAAVGTGALYKTIQHLNNEQAQQDALQQELGQQRQQIATLIGERNRLRQCQADDMTYNDCLTAKPVINTSAPAPDENAPNPAATTATPFELRRQIQEQQVYIKRLNGEISDLKTQLGG